YQHGDTAPQPRGATPQGCGAALQPGGTPPQPPGTTPRGRGTAYQLGGTSPQGRGEAYQSGDVTPQPPSVAPQGRGMAYQPGGGVEVRRNALIGVNPPAAAASVFWLSPCSSSRLRDWVMLVESIFAGR